MVKNLPAMQEPQEIQVQSLSGRSSGERNGNPFHYSFLENPMDRGAWQAKLKEGGVEVSQTKLN